MDRLMLPLTFGIRYLIDYKSNSPLFHHSWFLFNMAEDIMAKILQLATLFEPEFALYLAIYLQPNDHMISIFYV